MSVPKGGYGNKGRGSPAATVGAAKSTGNKKRDVDSLSVPMPSAERARALVRGERGKSDDLSVPWWAVSRVWLVAC